MAEGVCADPNCAKVAGPHRRHPFYRFCPACLQALGAAAAYCCL
jgi:hypothetical protein